GPHHEEARHENQTTGNAARVGHSGPRDLLQLARDGHGRRTARARLNGRADNGDCTMYREFAYDAVLASSQRAAWQLDEVLPDGAELDFTRPFLPEAFARTGGATGLSDGERLVLNHIRGHEYLAMFGLVEEFILPFVLDHARSQLSGDDYRVRALLQFAGEEAKHI